MTELPVCFWTDESGFRFRFADPMFASQTRKIFALYLRSRVGADSDMFAIELIFGELVSNVVKHASGPLEVRVEWQTEGTRLEVIDSGPGYELQARLPKDELSESHRGLFIVAAFGSDLRVDRRDGATVTSVTLPCLHQSLVA